MLYKLLSVLAISRLPILCGSLVGNVELGTWGMTAM